MTEEHFNRQRRNLILISVTVLFVNITGAQLNKINLLGNEISMTNSEYVPIFMGITLIYFLIRYLQYMHEVTDKGFKTRFTERVAKNLESYILRREYNNPNSQLRKSYENIEDIRYANPIIFHSYKDSKLSAKFGSKYRNGAVIRLNNQSITPREISIPYIKSGFYIVFRTSLITNYLFPLLTFLLAWASYNETSKVIIMKIMHIN